jgi:pyruvate dehydrogenase E2 component (dihydrolipoamide acetyltransferase)
MARLLRMPEVAANAVEAVLAEWPVPENTPFTAQDAIATVETEKAVVDVPADANGVILKTLVPAGAMVEVGAPIALLGDPGELVDDLDALLVELGVTPVTGPSAPAPTNTAMATTAVGTTAVGTTVTTDGSGARIFSSPLARRLAREAGLSIADLRGTGPGGRIVRRDVQRATDALETSHRDPALTRQPGVTSSVPQTPRRLATSAPAPAAYVDIPHTRMRRAIANRLAESARDAPHFFVRGTARVDKLLKLRARLNESGSVRVSVNDLVVTAAARAHVLVPAMNVIWTPDAVRWFSGVDISVAVATDAGLVAPVLRGVDQMTLSGVVAASSDLVDRARSGRLLQEELEGGTLTVTNLGGYGTEDFAAIINPPQSAILAVGAAREEPVVKKGRLRVGTVMNVTLSVDHRPIDGVVAAQWMAAFISLLEEPVQILV